ncbi:hypothetical protein DE146DRAFT_671318 [Phaeosphaeria sp. MPI-PUGE-AT-0046c]|nr:hypothetical protein DE146DRAFT_671318 [Phaeosphaeria sp. MPI-PUGE-AT-0046c]
MTIVASIAPLLCWHGAHSIILWQGLNHDIFDSSSNTTRRAKSSSLRRPGRLRWWWEWWRLHPPYPPVERRKRYATRVGDMPS